MPKKLLQYNILSMKDRIELSDLSKTFQDAMKVAQYLGLRYIWIDSLCIIQDSKEDWQKEAGLMGQVYSNSVCKISATGASDGSKGLFFDRHPLAIRPSEHALMELKSKAHITFSIHVCGLTEWTMRH